MSFTPVIEPQCVSTSFSYEHHSSNITRPSDTVELDDRKCLGGSEPAMNKK